MRDQGRCFDGLCVDKAWACVHRLTDGTELTIRMLRPEHRAAFLAGFEGLSPESRYLRFFTAMPRLPDAALQASRRPSGSRMRDLVVREHLYPQGPIVAG